MHKENLYEKICRYHKYLEDKNVLFLRHMFEYFDVYKFENNVSVDSITADKLVVFTAVKDFENKINFCEV